MDLSRYFAQFLNNIALGEPQVSRLNRAAQTISAFLVDSYAIPQDGVFMQGSYPNRTAVEPAHDDGEYDVDLVAICVPGGVSADDALSDLERRFRSDGRFAERVHRPPKKPCVRLDYATDDVGKFHVDVVPTRISSSGIAPLDAPRRGDGWHETAPREYTEWCRQQGDLYRRTVMMLKRWRDQQQNVRTAIKSIVLQVLVATCMPQIPDDAERIAATFRNLHNLLKALPRAPEVSNPVLPSENLAARWTVESFRSFVIELDEAVQWSTKALGAADEVEAADAWRELFGDDFPLLAPAQLGIKLGDWSHARNPSAMGWTEHHDARFAVTIRASQQRGRRSQNSRLLESGDLVFAPNKIHFQAQVVAPLHVSVYWQVANTGAHARSDRGLRGEIFHGRDLSGRPTVRETENWESTKYTGSHLIRAFLVRDNNVVATSDWFVVNIWAKGHPPAL